MPSRRDEEERLRLGIQGALVAHITAQRLSYATLGARTGISALYIRQALGSARPIGSAMTASIAWALGLRLVVTFEPLR